MSHRKYNWKNVNMEHQKNNQFVNAVFICIKKLYTYKIKTTLYLKLNWQFCCLSVLFFAHLG